MLRSAGVLARDNVAFLLEGVPIMYRELLFPVKKNGGEWSSDAAGRRRSRCGPGSACGCGTRWRWSSLVLCPW